MSLQLMRSLGFILLLVLVAVAAADKKGKGDDETEEISYTDAKVIGNGSFGVVYQARLIGSNELVAIKKVLQDRRYKV